MNIVNNIIKFFTKHRLLDGYVGVLGFVFWFRILAGYDSWFHIIYLQLKHVIGIDFSYHPSSKFYPLFTFSLSIGNNKFLINTGAEAARLTSEYLASFRN